jgi:divergent 4Fe-4S mono-cluster protein
MRPFCIRGGILQPRSDASGGPWDTLVLRVADERQSAVLAQIVRSNPGKSPITPTCVSTLRTVPKVSPWCSRSLTGSLSWSSREGASEAAIRQTVAACPSGALQSIADRP